MNLPFPIYFGDVPKVRDVRPALGKYRAREVVYLAERERFPSERFPSERRRLDSREDAYISHLAPAQNMHDPSHGVMLSMMQSMNSPVESCLFLMFSR